MTKKIFVKIGVGIFLLSMFLLGSTVSLSDSYRKTLAYFGHKPKCTCYLTKSKTFGVVDSSSECLDIECIPPGDPENPNLDLSGLQVCEKPKSEEKK